MRVHCLCLLTLVSLGCASESSTFVATGGVGISLGGSVTGGTTTESSATPSGGTTTNGGGSGTGNTAAGGGGKIASGGVSNSGGATSPGETTAVGAVSGGNTASAGVSATGGVTPSGGDKATGGSAGSSVVGGQSASGGASAGGTPSTGGSGTSHWVGTWACGPQKTENSNLPPSPGLAGNTLRQAVHVSIGGKQLRLRLSNEYGTSAVTMDSVHVAGYRGGGTIDTATDTALAFTGVPSVTIQAGTSVTSDVFAYALAPLSDLAVSIHFTSMSGDVTGHPGSRTTSYLQSGNGVASASLSSPAKTEHWYFITGIDVMADDSSAAIVVLGDSITDGRGSTTDQNNRWPDLLSRRLQANGTTNNISVLNQGIGGNNVIAQGLGPPASQRFDHDVINQTGVKWLIVLEGVNDIGASARADDLIDAYQQFITKAHQAGLLAFGVPILPFGNNTSYYSGDHEIVRNKVNDWIRSIGNFDAVIDMDAAVRDSANPMNLASTYDSGDGLHLSPAGYQKMADTVDLGLFTH